ncbi:unnamed protein product [Trichobilharzia szidati]|nr:unnamed protein product [Trichobilharzia szidati]
MILSGRIYRWISFGCLVIILISHGVFETECAISPPVYYMETGEERYFNFSPGFYDSNAISTDPSDCISSCAYYTYAQSAVVNGTYCFCGNILPPDSQLYDINCLGIEREDVYNVSQDAFVGPFEITTQNQTVNQAGNKIALNFVIPTEFLNLPGPKIYEFYYGDTVKILENISDINAPLEVVYHSPGAVWPTLKARNQDSTVTGSASLELMIYEVVTSENLIFSCPAMVVRGQLFMCQLTVSKGSHLQGTVNFTDEWQDSFALPEGPYDWIGMPPRRSNDIFINYNTNKLIITGSQARYSGTISTIQINARISSDVTFYLLRVQCTTGIYNFELNTCSLTSTASVVCDADQVFSGLVRDCVKVSATDCGSLRNLKLDTPQTVENYDYQIVNIYTAKSVAVGWQSIVLPSVWNVQSGDRIGFTSTIDGSIGCTPSDIYEADDLESLTIFSGVNGSSVLGSNLKRLTLMRHQIGAWIRPIYEATLSGMINASSGLKVISVQLNSYWGESFMFPASTQTTVYIDEPINETELITKLCATGKECLLELKAHSGINVTYLWDLGDGTPAVTTTVNNLKYVYTTPMNYNVTVNISNSVQFKVIVQNVTIIQQLAFNEIQSSQFAAKNEITTITLNITGSMFTCLWSLNNVPFKNDSLTRLDYIYNTTGLMIWNVTCVTPLENASRSLVQNVVERLTGLTLRTRSLPIAVTTPIVFDFITGSNLTSNLTFNDQILNSNIDYTQRTITSDPINIPWSMLGNYTLSVNNPLNPNTTKGQISFDTPLQGMSLQVQPNYVSPLENTIFRVSFRQGTSILLTVDYGDGEIIQQSAPLLQNWPTDNQLTKQYLNVSTYTVRFSASSGGKTENRSVNVYVIDKIGIYSATTSSEFSIVNNLINLTLVRQSGNPAVLTKISLDWGDGSPFITDDFLDGNVYNHVYKTQGDFAVTALLTNPIDQKVITTLIKARSKIENFGCQVLPNPVEKGKSAIISVSYKAAQNVVINALLNNGTDVRQFNLPTPQVTMINYTYPADGLYFETIQAVNLVSNQTCTVVVDVRNKIENVNIKYSGHAIYPPGIVSFTITYTGLPANFPTLAKYVVVWGDKSAPTEGMLTSANQPETVTRALTSQGYFQASVTLDNVISNMTQTIQIGAFGAFQQVDLQITVASTGDPGYGIERNCYPLGVPLKFQVYADGRPDNVANVTYSIINRNNNLTLDSATVWNNYFLYTFKQLGDYTAVVLASNPLSSNSTSKGISIKTSLRGLEAVLVGPGMLKPNEQGLIRISFQAYSDDTCICVTKNDGIGSVYYPQIKNPTSTCPLCPAYLRLENKPVNLTFWLGVQYMSDGLHYVYIQAMNPTKMVEAKVYVPVTYSGCPPPKLTIGNTSSRSPNYPIIAVSNTVVNIEANLTVPDCLMLQENQKLWTLESVDPDTVQPIQSVSLDKELSAKTLRLGIPANFLISGTYKATCFAYVAPKDSAVGYIVSAHTYIILLPPPLLVQFYDGNPVNKTIGLTTQEICLEPEVYSLDPEVKNRSSPQGIGSWIWYCRQINEEPSENLILPKPFGYQYQLNYTGCFGDGPGRINTSNGTLCFPTENLRINTTYEFTVIGSKPTRGIGKAAIQIITVNYTTPMFSVKQVFSFLEILCSFRLHEYNTIIK